MTRKVLAVVVAVVGVTIGCAQPPATMKSSAAPNPAPAAVADPEPLIRTLEEAHAIRKSDPQQYETTLVRLAKDDRRAAAELALHYFDGKRWPEAVAALEAAAARYPEVAPFLRLRVVRAHESNGDAAAAARVAEELAIGTTSVAPIARLRLPALYAELGDREQTDAWFAQVSRLTIDELNERDFVDLAGRLAKAGRPELAGIVRMRLLTDYTNGRWTERMYGESSAEIALLPLDRAVGLASKLAGANRYDQALDLLEKIAARFPDSQTRDLYRSVRIRSLFNSRNYGQLLQETAGVALNDPALMLTRARAAWRDDKPKEFLAGLAAVEKLHPQSKEAADAKIARSKYYITDEIDYGKSIRDLSAAIEAGAVGNDGENIWNLGWTHLLWGKDDDALAAFDRYIRSYPDGDWKTNSLFWSAKILDRRGNRELRDAKARQVIAEYPFSYYSYRVKELWALDAPLADPRPFPDLDAELAKVTDPRVGIIRELESIGMHSDATREMKQLAAANPDNLGVQFMLADVYVQGGEPFRANGVLQRRFRQYVRHGGSGIPRRFWEILFPLPQSYWETIRTEAARRNLDPHLITSIIRQESGFEPTTVSNAGAVGLMQIMPVEADRIATDGGLSGVTRESLFDPLINIAVGAAEFQQKLRRMQGSQLHAIAAYNAGETAVDDWIARTTSPDTDVFVESIPYAETRLYVKSVTRNRYEYKRIYGQ